MKNLQEILINNLIALRKQRGLTQIELGERVSYSDKTISKWENGTSLPDVMLIPDIAAVLKVKPEYLMKIIWIGETGERVEHFVFVNVRESSGLSYSIQIYNPDNFLYAKEIFDAVLTL